MGGEGYLWLFGHVGGFLEWNALGESMYVYETGSWDEMASAIDEDPR